MRQLKYPINIGDRFGRLIVKEKLANDAHGKRIFLCKCDCGVERNFQAGALYRGAAQSCGCLHKERVTKHGESKSDTTRSALYKKWRGIKIRCFQPSAEAYKYYGGRGITMCSEWTDYIPFQQWAYSSGYREGLQIDRIDPNGNYESSNCRWVSRKEQDYNKRNSLRFNGVPLKQLCQEKGMSYALVWRRINRGWDVEKALTTPFRTYKTK